MVEVEPHGIGWAVDRLKENRRVRRRGWNGKGMWLGLVKSGSYMIKQTFQPIIVGMQIDLLPWVGMKTADDLFVPWLCSQTDLLADDWELVEE